MPPINPPLKNDGPACRVCGCTEHNACFPVVNVRAGDSFTLGCSWVKTTGADKGPLCSACAGTAEDLVESITRARRLFLGTEDRFFQGRAILLAATTRYRKRKKEVDASR